MINLFETFDTNSLDLIRSQLYADFNIKAIVIKDNGFTPDQIDSPVKFFCNLPKVGHALYFNKVPFPKYWRIESKQQKANVYDLDKKRAEIIYNPANNFHEVMEVRFLNQANQISWVNHYNNHGFLFAKTYYLNNQPALKKYFNKEKREVIIQNLKTNNICLNFKQNQYHFENIQDFILFYLNLRNFNLDQILFNSVNFAQMFNSKLNTKDHNIFICSNTQDLDKLVSVKSIKHVLFTNYRTWQNAQNKLPKDHREYDFLGTIYPHPRSNHLKPNALILTNSDQIEGLEQIVKLMPNLQVNIASITTMSNKLLGFKKYNNVSLYPNVNYQKIAELFNICDVYLDINYQNEILNGVRSAFEQNMLITGFDNTLHNKQYVADSAIFKQDEVKQLADFVKSALASPANMQKCIDLQRKTAGDVAIDQFKQAFKNGIK